MTDQFTYITATNLSRLFRNRKISITKIISNYENHIENINSKLNTIVQLTKEQAITDKIFTSNTDLSNY